MNQKEKLEQIQSYCELCLRDLKSEKITPQDIKNILDIIDGKHFKRGIIENDESVTGTIDDLKKYFKDELARQLMDDLDYEDLRDNIKNTIELLDNLYEDTENEIFTDNDILKVSVCPMGGFIIERGESDAL